MKKVYNIEEYEEDFVNHEDNEHLIISTNLLTQYAEDVDVDSLIYLDDQFYNVHNVEAYWEDGIRSNDNISLTLDLTTEYDLHHYDKLEVEGKGTVLVTDLKKSDIPYITVNDIIKADGDLYQVKSIEDYDELTTDSKIIGRSGLIVHQLDFENEG